MQHFVANPDEDVNNDGVGHRALSPIPILCIISHRKQKKTFNTYLDGMKKKMYSRQIYFGEKNNSVELYFDFSTMILICMKITLS